MPLGSGKRDDRRRRALREDRQVPVEETPLPLKNPRRKMRYAHLARRKHQPKVTDFVPLRTWPLAFILVSLGLMVFTLAALPSLLGDSLQIDVSKRWNAPTTTYSMRLAEWIASSLFMLSAGVCWQILSVRRHRGDDYHGHYAVWRFGFSACIFASAIISLNLVHMGAEVISSKFAEGIWHSLKLWQTILILAPVTLVAGRLYFELRESTAATVSLGVTVAAALAYCISLTSIDPSATTYQNAETWAHVFFLLFPSMVFATLLFYSRHVVLDAHGVLGRRKKKVEEPAKAKVKPLKIKSDAKEVEASEEEDDFESESESDERDYDEDEIDDEEEEEVVAKKPQPMEKRPQPIPTQTQQPNKLNTDKKSNEPVKPTLTLGSGRNDRDDRGADRRDDRRHDHKDKKRRAA